MQYPKPIRDRIPAIIAVSGRQYHTTMLAESAFRAARLAKLVEEVQVATPEELLTEPANVLEVVDALLILHRFTLDREDNQRN